MFSERLLNSISMFDSISLKVVSEFYLSNLLL